MVSNYPSAILAMRVSVVIYNSKQFKYATDLGGLKDNSYTFRLACRFTLYAFKITNNKETQTELTQRLLKCHVS